jgi:hypothetical protein
MGNLLRAVIIKKKKLKTNQTEQKMIKSCKQLHEVLPKHVRVLNVLSPRMPHYTFP